MAQRIDFDLSMTIHPLTNDITFKRDSSAIRQSLRNIVLTSFYERGFNVNFGTNVKSSLFELYSDLDLLTMRDFVREGIENFEPEVEVVDISVSESEPNHIEITILYTEKRLPEVNSLTVVVNLIR